MQTAQHGGQVQGHDGGADGNLEGQGRHGQRDRSADGRRAALSGEHRQQAHHHQHTDGRGRTSMQQLDGGRTVKGKAEPAATQRPGIAGAARATADDQRSAEDQEIGGSGGAPGAGN